MSTTIKREKVTPAKARKWLKESNKGNRSIRLAVVSAYARDMVAGEWRFAGDPIRFDDKGNLLDGQHRLMAIVSSLTAMDALVIRGLEDDSRFVMDTGSKRNLGDVLKFEEHKNTALLAAAIRLCVIYERGDMNRGAGGLASTVTVNECLKWLGDQPSFTDSVNHVAGCKMTWGSIRTTLIAIRHYSGEMSGEADAFIESVAVGDNLPERHPCFELRRVLEYTYLRKGMVRSPRNLQACTIKAWNAYVAGNEVGHLRWNAFGKNAEKFPVITTGRDVPGFFDER